MGVYIAGMKMPKNEPLLVKINPDGSVSTTAKNGYKKYEAVSVPSHGRLIDADGEIGVNVTMMPGGKCRVDLIAPTIIPAEEETT